MSTLNLRSGCPANPSLRGTLAPPVSMLYVLYLAPCHLVEDPGTREALWWLCKSLCRPLLPPWKIEDGIQPSLEFPSPPAPHYDITIHALATIIKIFSLADI